MQDTVSSEWPAHTVSRVEIAKSIVCSDIFQAKININMHFYITNAFYVVKKTTCLLHLPDPLPGRSSWATLCVESKKHLELNYELCFYL